MTRHLIPYLAALLTIGVLDALWLGVVAKSMYRDGMGELMSPNPNLWAAAAFYLLYPIGVVIFAAQPSGDLQRAMLMGALFGLFCYGTYDLTNLAVVRGWPVSLTFIDIAWGAFVSAIGALAATAAARYFAAS